MIWSFIFAHLFVDFIIQTKEIADNKLDISKIVIHGMWVFSVTFIVSILSGFWSWNILIPILLIAVSHSVIDFLKARIESKIECKWRWLSFTTDQILHITIIIISIIVFYPSLKSDYLLQISELLHGDELLKILSFLILITFGGSYFTTAVCKAFGSNGEKPDNSLNKAGRYIGILERSIISASILVGRFEIIGFLIAAKSIIRHPEKSNKKFAEYFLVGTFTSFIWAALITYLFITLKN